MNYKKFMIKKMQMHQTCLLWWASVDCIKNFIIAFILYIMIIANS